MKINITASLKNNRVIFEYKHPVTDKTVAFWDSTLRLQFSPDQTIRFIPDAAYEDYIERRESDTFDEEHDDTEYNNNDTDISPSSQLPYPVKVVAFEVDGDTYVFTAEGDFS